MLELLKIGKVDEVALSIDAAAEAKKTELLAAAKACTGIADGFELELAVDALKAVNDHLDALEASRVEVKRPVDNLAKRIQTIAKTHAEGLTEESDRLSRMIGEHQLAERRKAEDARRKAAEEEARILADAEAKERERIAQENHGRTGTLAADLEKQRAEVEEKIVETRIAAASKAELAPKGTKVRTTVIPEVFDIAALHAARPDLTVIEVNSAAVKAALKNPVFLKDAQAGKIPGLRVREEVKASV